jgi:hypothetical protein
MDKKDKGIVYLDEFTPHPAPGEDKLWDRLTELREEYGNILMSVSIGFKDTYTNSNSRMLSRSSLKKFMDLECEMKKTLDEMVEAEIEHHQLGEDK